MPRLDFFADLHPGLDPFATEGIDLDPGSAVDPQLRSYRSGFWGVAPVPASDPGRPVELSVRARLDDGRTASAPIASIQRVGAIAAPLADPRPPAGADRAGGELVAICMATYNPPPELFAAQIASIRAQTHGNWICVISDDRSSDTGLETIQREVGADPRFVVSVAPRRLGFYNNFERALALAPRAARFVAMADQDDRWYPDKLERLLGAIGDAKLVYSDQRVIARDGELLSDTYWSQRRNNHSDLLSLLVANSVTGAASLLRSELLDVVLPFPPPQFAHFHDHWVALVARACRPHRLRRRAAVRLRPAPRRVAWACRRQSAEVVAGADRRPARPRAPGCGCGACTISSTSPGSGPAEILRLRCGRG